MAIRLRKTIRIDFNAGVLFEPWCRSCPAARTSTDSPQPPLVGAVAASLACQRPPHLFRHPSISSCQLLHASGLISAVDRAIICLSRCKIGRHPLSRRLARTCRQRQRSPSSGGILDFLQLAAACLLVPYQHQALVASSSPPHALPRTRCMYSV